MQNITVHIGIHYRDLPLIGQMNRAAPVGIGVMVDDDGWAEWGESRSNGVNAPSVYHVTIDGSDIPTVLDLIRTYFTDHNTIPIAGGYADPSTCPKGWEDYRLIITTYEDWAEKLLERRTLAPLPL